jgi:hypothetical protein
MSAFGTTVLQRRSDRTVAARVRSPLPLVVLTVILLGVSGGLLWLLGVNYDGLTGSAAAKVHPFTYLAILLLGWRAITSGNVVAFCVRSVQQSPAAVLIAAVGTALLCFTVARNAPGMAGAVDTFIAPGLFLLLLSSAGDRELRPVETAIHALMTVNALLALTEFATGTRFFPYRFDGEIFATDTRSTALLGHPLQNAMLTACYLMTLLSGARALPRHWKLPMIALQCAALVTFGGRSAMVVSLLLGGVYLLGQGYGVLRRGRVSLVGVAAVAVLVTTIPIVVVGLAAGGFFEALLTRFESDGGSANARVEMFSLFSMISPFDLLIGPDTAMVDGLRRAHGLEWGIENPIVKMLLYQGVLMTIVLIVAVVLYLVEIVRRCGKGVWLPLLAIVILLNTSETIGGKTLLLAQIAVLLIAMYRPEPNQLRAVASSGPARR